MYSSSFELIKSTKALQWVILQLIYLLLGSKFSLLKSLEAMPVLSSFLTSNAWTLADYYYFLTGIDWRISFKIPSDLIFSMI